MLWDAEAGGLLMQPQSWQVSLRGTLPRNKELKAEGAQWKGFSPITEKEGGVGKKGGGSSRAKVRPEG